MIMRGTTPRSLTWTGCLGLAALAALLLPVLPTWAQTESIQKDIEERLKAVQQAQKAEQLRKEAIELQLRDRDRQKGDEIDQARVEVKQLAAQLDEMHAHMKAVEDKLKAAHDRLTHLEGRGGAGIRAPGKPGEKVIIILKDADGRVREIELPPGGGDILKRFELELKPGTPKPPAPPVPGTAPSRPVPPAVRPLNPPPVGGSVEERLREVEKRLEMILKRLESRSDADNRGPVPPPAPRR